MATELISEFVDLTGLNSQKDAVLKALNEMQQGMDKLAGSKVSFEGAGNLKQAGQASKQYIDAVNQLDAAQQKLIATSIKLAKADEAAAKAATASAKAQEAEAKAKERTAKYTASLNKEKERLNKETIKEEERLGKLNNAYEQLKNKYQIAANVSKQLAAAKGLDNEETKEAIAVAQKYYAELLKIEQAVGQSQRQVGNYTQATFALNQVIREAPAFANSFATGISAISNNIPILLDEFKKLREATGSGFKAIQILAGGLMSFGAILPLAFAFIQAYGDDIVNFFSSMIKGADAVDQLTERMKQLNSIRSEAAKSAGEELASMEMLYLQATNLTLSYEKRKQAVDALQEQYPKYFENLNDEAIMAGNASAAYEALRNNIIQASIARAAQKAAAPFEEELFKVIESRNRRNTIAGDFIDPNQLSADIRSQYDAAITAAKTEVAKQQIRFQYLFRPATQTPKVIGDNPLIGEMADKKKEEELKNKIFQIYSDAGVLASDTFIDYSGKGDKDKNSGAIKLAQDEAKAEYEIEKKKLEDIIALNETFANMFEVQVVGDYEQREAAARAAATARKQLAAEEEKFMLKEIELRAQKEKVSITAFENEIFQITQDRRDKELDAEAKYLAAVASIRQSMKAQIAKDGEELVKMTEDQNKKIYEQQVEGVNNSFAGRMRGIQDQLDAELQIELDNYKRGEITKEQYEARKIAIEDKYQDKSFQANIDFYKALLAIVDIPEKEREAALKKLEDIEDKYRQNTLKKEEDVENRKTALRRKSQDLAIDLAKQAGNAFFEAMGFGYEEEKNRIQESIDNLENKKRKEIEVAEQTSTSEEEKAAKIAVISAKAQNEKNKLEQQQRKLDTQKAQLEKASALFNIGVTTAMDVFKIKAQAAVLLSNPVTAPLAAIALAQIPLVIASGALAAGLIAAKPIPKYKHGKDKSNKYEGLAWVGDGGKEEAIIRESGEVEITPNKDTLAWVGKNDVVLPDASKLAMQFAMNKTNSIAARANHTKQPDSIAEIKTLTRVVHRDLGNVIVAVKDSKPTVIHKGINRDLLMKYGSSWTNYI